MRFTRSNRVQALSALLLLASACGEQVALPRMPNELSRISATAHTTASDRYIVHFKADGIPADFAARIAAMGGTVQAAYDGAGLAVVERLDAVALAQLSADRAIEAVDADNVFRFIDSPESYATIDITQVSANSATNPTTAVLFPFQWNMRAVRADAAWAAGQLGSRSVKVAIIDSGIDYLHPDLLGLVDLASSASFVPAEDAVVPILFPGREVFTDLNFHGTHVAAIVSSNALLAAGVGSRTTLMAVKVLDVNGNSDTSTMVAGVLHAADHGANIINLSIGVRDLLSRETDAIRGFERAMNRVFRYVKSRGAAVVVSAGNEAQDLDENQTFKVFCGLTHVICVSATGPTSGGLTGPWLNIDAPASYTNFGHTAIEVAAPGGNGTSSILGPCSQTSLVIPACRTSILVLALQGTSFAAPHVSGLGALILSQQGGMSASQLKTRLGKTADDLGAAGRDDYYGRGRINAKKALGL